MFRPIRSARLPNKFLLYDNIAHLNHCENLEDMKAAVEQNIDEISSKMEERRRILYAIGDERYKKNILQEYVDDRLQAAGVADKAYLLHIVARSVTAFVNILLVLLLLTRHR